MNRGIVYPIKTPQNLLIVFTNLFSFNLALIVDQFCYGFILVSVVATEFMSKYCDTTQYTYYTWTQNMRRTRRKLINVKIKHANLNVCTHQVLYRTIFFVPVVSFPNDIKIDPKHITHTHTKTQTLFARLDF